MLVAAGLGGVPVELACQSGDAGRGSEFRDPVEPVAVADREAPRRYPGRPERPLPVVWFEPMDSTTAAGGTVPRVGVYDAGAPVPLDLLSRLARVLTLRTWPGLAVVETVVTTVPSAAHEEEGDPRALVELRPSSPLGGACQRV